MRSADWKTFAWWVTGISVGAFFLALVLRAESQRQLESSATDTASRWTQSALPSVPDLEQVFTGSGLTPSAREQLLRLRKVDDVFRFKLYDRSGRLVLVSDDLVADRPLPRYDQSLGIGQGADAQQVGIRDKVLAGGSHVELRRHSDQPGLGVFSEAYVAVQRDGVVLGLVNVSVDQTRQVATARGALLRIGGTLALLLAVALGVAGLQFWRRLRRQRLAVNRGQYIANHDALSGALNRSSFNELLRQAAWRRAEGGPVFALMCIDLDYFKEVNDSLGHDAGDEVLRVARQRLNSCVREGDHVARLGGDEFAVVLFGSSTEAALTPLAQRIVHALAQVYDVAGQQVRCGGSVGVAIHGVDAVDPDELLGKADLALYRAKANGRATFSFYDVAMDRQMQARRELTRDLREAVSTGQLTLHYQPLFASDARTLTGYEALLRWNHPARGEIPPAEFIPLAEETGVINQIGLWVLRGACREAAGWPASLTVAVNLSALQFAGNNLVQLVAEALADSGLAPQRLELEITESLLMSNTDQVLGVLRALSRMGVTIAMDDFGTGYSSLAYLWRFPFDKVKIDRAFTHNLGHDEKVALIVQSIISLAHSLDIRVNAEGVETASQMAALQDGGCDELQGFLLGRPGPAASLTHLGHVDGDLVPGQRTEARRSLFGTIPPPLPPGRTGPIV
ncbi:MAG: bifunctional diguanylate cyclase/phosphodiesterase [Rhodoferax sp.]|nr:bifunctional diguanylate cyclase/phosphodiesterase [Rhodoferax sp.]